MLFSGLGDGEYACRITDVPGLTATSAIFKLQKADGSPSKVPILILEVRLQDQLGGVRPPAIEAMCNNYTAQILPLMGTPAQANTKLPAVGLEVVGSRLRVYALYFTDFVQSEMLSEAHYPRSQDIVQLLRQSTEQPTRAMTALKKLCHGLCKEMAPYAEI